MNVLPKQLMLQGVAALLLMTCQTQVTVDDSYVRLDDWLTPHRDEYALPAVGAILVGEHDILAFGVTGMRSIDHDIAVRPNDRWHLGSLTKSMTATVAARLVDAGQLDFDDTVSDVLPGRFPDMLPDYHDVTLEQLLRHRSGLTGELTGLSVWRNIDTSVMDPVTQREHLLDEVLQLPPEFPPGQGWLYSNAAYVLAGVMLEQASGMAWEQLVEKELFQPLYLQKAGIGAPGTAGDVPDQPRGHDYRDGELSSVEPGPFADHPPAMAPAGTVHMSLDDLGRYLQAHLAGLRSGHELLPARLFERLHAPEGEESYASGWFVTRAAPGGDAVSSHEGSNTMWMAVALVLPAEGLALAVVANRVPEDLDALVRIAGQLLSDYRAGGL